MINVSFIVPSYNSYQTIDRTIRSILALKSFESVKEVIVVDSSDDGKTRQVVDGFVNKKIAASPTAPRNDTFDGTLRVIYLDKKTSPALGRNMGANEAKGDLLCFIDSDIYLDENWLENVLNAYKSGCLVGCGSVSIPSFQKDSKIALAQLYLQFNETLCAGVTRSAALVPSCNMFCKKELFKSVGGFPSLRASEDTMFCLNLAKKEKIWFIPSAKAFHIFREEWKGFRNNQILLGQYIIIYRRIHYKSWIYKGVMPVILFPGFLLIKSLRMTWRIYKAGHFKKYLQSVVIYKLGLFYWSCGFIKGCFSKI